MARNIVLCLDGTSDEVGASPTNVIRMFYALQRSPDQVIYYNPGVGTMLDPRALGPFKKRFLQGLDLAAGFGIRDIFIEAYNFLCRNFEPDDRIYLFGFSRGAYTARALAGAIHMFGLLYPEHQNLTPYVWQRYSTNDAAQGSIEEKRLFATAALFRGHFARQVPIAFLGAWDTVSSFGLIKFRTLPYTRKNSSILQTRHAVSIDEHRAVFPANPFDPQQQNLKELWFAGVHGDVGGGVPPAEAGQSMVAFQWMVNEAVAESLLVDNARLGHLLANPAPDPKAKLHDSLLFFYRLLGLLPMKAWNPDRERFTWRWFRFSNLRQIPDGALVHNSVEIRLNADKTYRPKNLDPARIVFTP